VCQGSGKLAQVAAVEIQLAQKELPPVRILGSFETPPEKETTVS